MTCVICGSSKLGPKQIVVVLPEVTMAIDIRYLTLKPPIEPCKLCVNCCGLALNVMLEAYATAIEKEEEESEKVKFKQN